MKLFSSGQTRLRKCSYNKHSSVNLLWRSWGSVHWPELLQKKELAQSLHNHFHTSLQQHNSHSPHSQSSVTALVPRYKLFYLIPHCHRERRFLLQLHFHKPAMENWCCTFSNHRKPRNLGSKTNAISLTSWNTSFVHPQVNPTALYSGTAYTQHANRNLRLYKPQGERCSQIWGARPHSRCRDRQTHIWQQCCILTWTCMHIKSLAGTLVSFSY